MIAKKSLTVLLLAVLGSQADAALRRRTAGGEQDVRKLADGEKKRLLKDDAGFWARFVQEVQSSLPPVCPGDGGPDNPMLECPECCDSGACIPCPPPVCPGEGPGVGPPVDGGMLDCPECCEDGECVPCPAPVCPGDGGPDSPMLDCPECCDDGACVPCPPPVCPGECPGVGPPVDGGMLDCPECCEDGECVPCPQVCPGEPVPEGGSELDCGMDCCEEGACVPCPPPVCPGEPDMGGGILDCGDDCCEDGGCVPCPAAVCPGEPVPEGGSELDCGMDCCEDGACVPCPAPVCPGDMDMGGGFLDCGEDCCEDGACVPCPVPVCPDEPDLGGGFLDCGADCCEAGACVPCPTPEVCELEMDIQCPDCTPGETSVQNCEGRPLQITMLYAGGGCDMSRNCQDDKFSCADFNGGPPTEFGTESWIVATDDDEETIFFEGWSSVGSAYLMNNGFERFPADQIIRVYASENTADASQLLQEVMYHSSCSQNLDLLNRFGSQVIVGWFNEEQGNITGFDNTTFSVSVDIPIDATQFEGQPATVTGLTILKSYTTSDGITATPEFFNLTDSVAGTQVGPGETFDAELAIPINLAVEAEYTFLVTLSAETVTGVDCTATEILQFTAGGSPLELGSTQACPGDEDGGGGNDKDDKDNDKDDKDRRR